MNLTKKEKVAIIIPTFNRVEITRNIITQILNQDYSNFQIIICDSDSSDGTQNLNYDFPMIEIINVGINRWWTGAINKGIDYALNNKFPLLLLLNDDIEIPKNLLSTLLRYQKENSKCLITPRQLDMRGNYYLGSNFEGVFKSRKNISSCSDSINFFDASNGCCVLASDNVFKEIGFVNEKLIPHYGGDIFIFLKAKNKGFRCLTISKLIIKQTSITNYLGKINIKNMLFHPSSHVHLYTYFLVGREIHDSWFKFLFFGIANHYYYVKEVLKTLKNL